MNFDFVYVNRILSTMKQLQNLVVYNVSFSRIHEEKKVELKFYGDADSE